MNVNELTERVDFRRYVETENQYGTQDRTATALAQSIRAQVRPMSGRETDRGNQTEPRANYLVTIRNASGLDVVTEGDFVIWRGLEMNIRFFRNRGHRPRFLEIEAELNAP